MPDTSSHVATRRDDLHTMTLRELEAKIIQAGIVMSHRQILRHCKAGTFEAKKLPATNNVEEWFIAPASVDKGIADIRTLQELRSRRDATRRDMSDSDAGAELPRIDTDRSSHDATRRDMSDNKNQDDGRETDPVTSRQGSDDRRYVEQLEKRIEEKDFVIGMLSGELAHRNDELVRRNERERETNILIRGLQNLVLRLQGGSPTADVLDDDRSMQPGSETGADGQQ
jgi:hypothetical protein